MKIENVLGYEREFMKELETYLGDCFGDILDDSWDFMHSYLKKFYKNGKEFMWEAVRDIEDAGYKLKGFDNWSNIKYYMWDLIEDNIYFLTATVLKRVAVKEKERIDYYNAVTLDDMEKIVEDASMFYDAKTLRYLKDLVLVQVKKMVNEDIEEVV